MVINQPGAIGDLIFLEPIFRHFWKLEGSKPVVIVYDHLMNLQPYFESATFWPATNAPVDIHDMGVKKEGYLNMRWANQILRGFAPDDHHDVENTMLDKYRLIGLDPELWKTIDLKFDEDKAMELLHSVTKEKDENLGYGLINETSGIGKVIIPQPPHLPCFYMSYVPGFTVIDWFMVIMCASENHHVSTSTFYLMQAIHNKYPHMCFRNFIYPRPNRDYDGLRGISQLKPTFKFELVND